MAKREFRTWKTHDGAEKHCLRLQARFPAREFSVNVFRGSWCDFGGRAQWAVYTMDAGRWRLSRDHA